MDKFSSYVGSLWINDNTQVIKLLGVVKAVEFEDTEAITDLQ
jgi:hypothetical protein